ncbi:hypothetical protein LTS10_007821 [Elasticomyces elasticus]|nr:hypothetical protein LTS10_007821 [Elasticomyces elasticus]
MADDTPPAKRVKLDFSQSLRVFVGEANTEFIVHKDFITLRSTFFKAAAKNQWNTGTTKDIKLPEDDPAVFSGYLQCLYTSEFMVDNDALDNYDDIMHVFSIYQLADKLGDLKRLTLSSTALWS